MHNRGLRGLDPQVWHCNCEHGGCILQSPQVFPDSIPCCWFFYSCCGEWKFIFCKIWVLAFQDFVFLCVCCEQNRLTLQFWRKTSISLVHSRTRAQLLSTTFPKPTTPKMSIFFPFASALPCWCGSAGCIQRRLCVWCVSATHVITFFVTSSLLTNSLQLFLCYQWQLKVSRKTTIYDQRFLKSPPATRSLPADNESDFDCLCLLLLLSIKHLSAFL